jgi:predicted DCC family thiol-disulfide oxidoreductase YuxK
MNKKAEMIVFYDGDCGLCNRSMTFILRHEKNHDLHFASLQSDFTKERFNRHQWRQPDLDTFYLLKDDELLDRSDAALEVAKHLKAPLSWLRIFRFIPKKWRDSVYNLVAANRKKVSFKKCMIPSPEQALRFLDR